MFVSVADVKVGRLIGGEEPAERRKRQLRLALAQRPEDGLHTLVGVVVAVPSDGVARALAQAPGCVAIGVGGPRGVVGRIGVQDFAVLRGHDEDQPVDQPQKLPEELLFRQPLVAVRVQPVDQRLVRGVLQEAAPEVEQRLLDAVPKILARGDALLATELAPALQDAVGARRRPLAGSGCGARSARTR